MKPVSICQLFTSLVAFFVLNRKFWVVFTLSWFFQVIIIHKTFLPSIKLQIKKIKRKRPKVRCNRTIIAWTTIKCTIASTTTPPSFKLSCSNIWMVDSCRIICMGWAGVAIIWSCLNLRWVLNDKSPLNVFMNTQIGHQVSVSDIGPIPPPPMFSTPSPTMIAGRPHGPGVHGMHDFDYDGKFCFRKWLTREDWKASIKKKENVLNISNLFRWRPGRTRFWWRRLLRKSKCRHITSRWNSSQGAQVQCRKFNLKSLKAQTQLWNLN